MKKLLLLLLLPLPVFAQQPAPNCLINFGPWTDTNISPISFNGGATQCAYWVLTYQTSGFSAISIRFDSATGTTGAPGTFAAFQGTTVSGSNPSTSVTCSTPTNCTAVFSGVVGWYRVNFLSHTGSGTIQGTLQGYKTYTALGGNAPAGGSGCAGTVATPCVVAGPDATGAPPTQSPVYAAGNDGTNVRPIAVDTTGRPKVVGAAANGAAVAGNPVQVCGSDGTNCRALATDTTGHISPAGLSDTQADARTNAPVVAADSGFAITQPVYPYDFNGATWDRQFYCPNQAAVTLTAGTDAVLVTGVAAKKTYICHLDFAATATGTFTIQQGTGSTCGTGTAAITGAYPSINALAIDYTALGALHGTVAANDICLHAGAAATVGGFVTYAQF